MYEYKAYTLDKEVVQGTIDAPSENVAEELLRGAGYHRILTLTRTPPAFTLKRLFPYTSQLKKSDFVDFFQQLATLLDSQMPFIQSLWLLAEQAPKAALSSAIHSIGQDVAGGAPFSHALAKYPRFISSHYCQVIKVSEKSGDLTRGLRLVAGYMEKEASLSGHVKRMLSYPAFLAITAAIVIVVVAMVAVPSLSKLFASLGVDLPLVTRMLIAIASFITVYKFHILAGVLGAVGIGMLLKRQTAVKKLLDAVSLKMPVIGKIIIMRNVCRFCRSSAMLIEAGLTLPQALSAIIGTVDSDIIRQALAEVRREIIKGKGLALPMQRAGFFPRLLIDVVAVGEKTGTLQSSFATMADYYEKRLDMRVQGLLGMIEPTSIIIVGLIISFIGIAIITPLYSVYQNLGPVAPGL